MYNVVIISCSYTYRSCSKNIFLFIYKDRAVMNWFDPIYKLKVVMGFIYNCSFWWLNIIICPFKCEIIAIENKQFSHKHTMKL